MGTVVDRIQPDIVFGKRGAESGMDFRQSVVRQHAAAAVRAFREAARRS